MSTNSPYSMFPKLTRGSPASIPCGVTARQVVSLRLPPRWSGSADDSRRYRNWRWDIYRRYVDGQIVVPGLSPAVLRPCACDLYDPSMKTKSYPLAMPEDLLIEVRETASATGLSLAAAMRQSMRLGLPRLRETLAPATMMKPFSRAEARRAFGPDPEADAVAARLARRRRPEPRNDG